MLSHPTSVVGKSVTRSSLFAAKPRDDFFEKLLCEKHKKLLNCHFINVRVYQTYTVVLLNLSHCVALNDLE